MAITKIKTISARLDAALRYIVNPQKTAGGTLVGSFNCRPDAAFSQMTDTKTAFGKTGKRQGYHLIQSFKPGEVTPEKTFEIAQEYVKRYLADRYEVVFSVHQDKDHIHAHVVWNAVSFVDGRKYHADNREYPDRIRRISDDLCREHDLSVIEPTGKGKHYAERAAETAGRPTVRSQIKADLDAIIARSYNLTNFYDNLRKAGYAIRRGPNIKHTSIRPPYSSKSFRLDSLGEAYIEAAIQERIMRAAPTHGPAIPTGPTEI